MNFSKNNSKMKLFIDYSNSKCHIKTFIFENNHSDYYIPKHSDQMKIFERIWDLTYHANLKLNQVISKSHILKFTSNYINNDFYYTTSQN